MPHHRRSIAGRLRRTLLILALSVPLASAGFAAAAQGGPGTVMPSADGSTQPGTGGATQPGEDGAIQPGDGTTQTGDGTTQPGGTQPGNAQPGNAQPGAPAEPAPSPAPKAPVVGSLVPALGSAPAAPVAAAQPASDGARVVDMQRVNPQTVDLTIFSPALGGNTPVRLLLPKDWEASPKATWPTLYMLPGYDEVQDYKSWTFFTDIAGFMSDKNVLTVLPSDDRTGFFTNWWNYGAQGTPSWETYHTQELPKIIQTLWRGSDRRAIAGLSMGGYGAMAYAAKHPGMYAAAASYSGLLHTTAPGVDRFCQLIVRKAGGDGNAFWGDPVLQSGIWQANDPWWLAAGLKGTEVFLSSNAGPPGPHDPSAAEQLQQLLSGDLGRAQPVLVAPTLEALANITTRDFQERLGLLGIPATTAYGFTGTHSWGYWQDAFHTSWPMLADALGVATG